jgi:hypothetical protein
MRSEGNVDEQLRSALVHRMIPIAARERDYAYFLEVGKTEYSFHQAIALANGTANCQNFSAEIMSTSIDSTLSAFADRRGDESIRWGHRV